MADSLQPSTSSSAASSSERLAAPTPRSSSPVATTPTTTMGSKRQHPLQPPPSLGAEDMRRDPFRTPDASVPPTPRSVASNPFSPPASVLNLSSEQNMHGVHQSVGSIGSLPYYPFPQPGSAPGSRPHTGASRVSIQSSLRNSTTDLQVHDVPRGMGPGTRSRRSSHGPVRSSYMSPPAMPKRATVVLEGGESNGGSTAVPTIRSGKRHRSSMLTGEIEKPWVTGKDFYERLSYYVTYSVAMLGIVGSVLRVYFSWVQTPRLGNLCLVMEDNFDTFDNQYTWFQEVDMSGFGNGEFEMTTNSPNNSFVEDGKLYLVPTLTSDVIGTNNVLNGFTYNITGCTAINSTTGCGAVSNETAGVVINPVMSARISTKHSHNIQYGRVEVVAKLPQGDWIWPSIWMLPVEETYGAWPASGEIDIMQARGNAPSYPAQGVDYVRGSLQWGPFTWLNGVSRTFGWWTNRRQTFAEKFHTFAMEWSPEFIRLYVDSRLTYMLYLRFNEPFFKRGDFPPVVQNGTDFISTPDPWKDGTPNVAPFDKPFYLIMNVAVGGTSGWFPDGAGNKPWLDHSLTAMQDFALAQDEWYATWPQNIAERAMVVDSVKMWQRC